MQQPPSFFSNSSLRMSFISYWNDDFRIVLRSSIFRNQLFSGKWFKKPNILTTKCTAIFLFGLCVACSTREHHFLETNLIMQRNSPSYLETDFRRPRISRSLLMIWTSAWNILPLATKFSNIPKSNSSAQRDVCRKNITKMKIFINKFIIITIVWMCITVLSLILWITD